MQRHCEQNYMLSATKQLVSWYCISWLEVNDSQNEEVSALIHIDSYRICPPPPKHQLASLPTSHFLQGGRILQILPVFKNVDLGPVLGKNGLSRPHGNPMAEVLQHHRVLVMRSTGRPVA